MCNRWFQYVHRCWIPDCPKDILPVITIWQGIWKNDISVCLSHGVDSLSLIEESLFLYQVKVMTEFQLFTFSHLTKGDDTKINNLICSIFCFVWPHGFCLYKFTWWTRCTRRTRGLGGSSSSWLQYTLCVQTVSQLSGTANDKGLYRLWVSKWVRTVQAVSQWSGTASE